MSGSQPPDGTTSGARAPGEDQPPAAIPSPNGSPGASPDGARLIPDRAFFLQPESTRKGVPRSEVHGEPVLPSLCGAVFVTDKSIIGRRTMKQVYGRPGDPASEAPRGTIYQTITGYSGSVGSKFMMELEQAVERCAVDYAAAGARYIMLGEVDAMVTGRQVSDSVLIQAQTPRFDSQGKRDGTRVLHIAVLRMKQFVVILRDEGWEDTDDTLPEIFDGFTSAAVGGVEKWLG